VPESLALAFSYFFEAAGTASVGTAAEAVAAGAITASEIAGASAASAAGAGALATAASFIGRSVVGAVTSMALSAAFSRSATNKSPLGLSVGAAGALADQARTLSGIAAAGEWEVVYGRARKGGRYVFRTVTDVHDNATLTEELAVPYSDPYSVTVSRADVWGGTVSIDSPQYDEDSASYRYVSVPYSVSGGTYTFDPGWAGSTVRISYTATGAGPVSNHLLHLVLVLASHQCEAIDAIYFGNDLVELDGAGNATGKYAGHVYIEKYLGSDTQPASAALIAAAPDKWTTEHRGRGHCYLYVRLLRNNNLFPQGMPNISVEMRGRNQIFDVRDSGTRYTENAALIIADYLNNSTFGLGAAYTSEIDSTQLIAAANLCDEDLSLAAGGWEKRYAINGVINTGQTPQDILGKLLTAMAGQIVYIGGKWFVHPGAWVAPAMSFAEGDCAGNIQVSPAISNRDKFNAVKGVYVSPANLWQPSDFPAIQSSTFKTQDNNELRWADIELPFTITASAAQRLAKIFLLENRQQITCTVPMKMQAYRAKPPEVIQFSNAFYGWTNKNFRIQELKFAFGETLTTRLALRETDSTVYDWSTSEEQAVDPAPNTQLPDPGVVKPPGVVTVTEEVYRNFGSGAKSKAIVTWVDAGDSSVVGYDVQWLNRDTGVSVSDTGVVGNRYEIFDTTAATYLVQVRGYNILGARSTWSAVQVALSGLTAPPPDVPWFVIDDDVVAWNAPDDLDVSGYVLRFHYGVNLSWGDANPLHGGLVTQSPFTLTPRPAGQVTLMIKAVDALGTESANPAYIITDLGDPQVANVVETIDLGALGWPGDIVNGAITGGAIKANDASGLMWGANENTAMWSFDSALMWHATIYFDLYYVATVWPTQAGAGSQLTLAHSIDGVGYSIEYRRNGPAAMWSVPDELMWSGDDTRLMWTPPPGDFPRPMWHNAGDLMWSADAGKLMWQVMQGGFQTWPGEITALNEPYDFRVSILRGATRGQINSMVFTVDMPDIVERLNDVAIASGGTNLPITKTYRAIKNINFTVQSDGHGGIGGQIVNKQVSGPNVKVYDAAGAAVAGVIDAVIQGY
jgi:hypothetical protein